MRCARCGQPAMTEGACRLCGARGEEAQPGGPGSVVGRERELEVLRSAFDRHREPGGVRGVVVRGSFGVGKSRLVEALVSHAGARGAKVDVLAPAPDERFAALGVRELLLHRFPDAARSDDPASGLRSEELGAEDAELSAELFAFALGQSDPRFRSRHMEPSARWDAVHRSVAAWVRRGTEHAPWLIAFEDVHALDAQTAAFAKRLLSEPGGPLVLLTVQPEELGDGSPWSALISELDEEHRLAMVELGELDVKELARALEPRFPGRPELALKVAQQAEGHPRFALEMVALLSEQRLAGKDVQKLPLPGSIHEAWSARLDRLSGPAVRVIQRAAVVGQRFFDGALRALGLTADELSEGLRELEKKGLIRPEQDAGVPGERGYAFRYALLREVASSRVNPADRTAWLSQVDGWAVAALAAAGEKWEPLGPVLLPLLARVREERARPHDASLLQEVLAGVWRRQQRPAQAVAALKKALPPSWGTRKLVLLRQLADEQHVLGELAQALATASTGTGAVTTRTPQVPAEVERLLGAGWVGPLDRWDRLGYAEAELSLQVTRAELLAQNGRSVDVQPTLEALEQRLDPLSSDVGQKLRLKLAKVFTWFLTEVAGNNEAAQALLERVEQRLDLRTLTAEDRLLFLRAQTLPASRLGQFDRSLVLVDEELRLAARLGQRRDEAVAWNSKGIMLMACGRMEEAGACYQRSIAISQEIGFLRRQAIATHNLGLVALELGRREEAHALQERYVEISRTIGNKPAEAYGPATRAAVELALGDDGFARALIDQAQRMAQEHGWPILASWCRALDGQRQLLAAVRHGDRQKLISARDALAAGLKAFSAEAMLWSEEFDPGEHTAFLVAALLRLDEPAAAQERIAEARQRIPGACLISHQWLGVAEAMCSGEPVEMAVRWFDERSLVRAARLARALA